MAKFNKDTQNRINAITEEAELQKNMQEILTKKVGSYKTLSTFQKDLVSEMKGESDVSAKLTKLQEKKEEIIKSTNKTVMANKDLLLEQLETAEKLLTQEKKRKDLSDEIKDIGKDFTKDLGSALGISNQLVEAFFTLSAAAIGLAILKEVVSYITDSVGRIKEFRNEFGTTPKQAVSLNDELLKSRFTLEGMILGSDKLEAGMKSIVSETGNFKLATSEMITNVAELSEMMDSGMAVSLARSLKNAGHNTEELVEHARNYSEEIGISGAEGMKYLADNQLELVGLSGDQLKLKIEEGMELKKMGADMEHLNSLASEALDLESSLKNEMKLRAMTGKEISFNELRAAQASGDKAAIAAAEKKLIDELGPSLEGNLQVQRMISDATGLSKEQMLNYKNATIEATAESDKNSDSVEGTTKMAGLLNQTWVQIGGGILLAVGAIALLGAAMKKLGAGKGVGSGLAKAFRGLSLGLASLANPASLLGLAALTVAMIGLGFALKLAAPAFEAIGKAIATVVKSIGEFIIGFAEIASPEKVLAMLGLAASFGAVAAALLAFGSAGIFAMPAMAAVGMFTATMSALGMSGGGESSGDSELISEIKGLRSDIQSQPILINVDGRVVSQITKVQNRKNSTRTSGYGG
jgi:hypothetical protein